MHTTPEGGAAPDISGIDVDQEVARARGLAQAGRLAEAARLLGALLETAPNHFGAHLLDVDLRLARGDAVGAATAADHALRVAPSRADAHVADGRAKLAGARPGAAAAFQRALGLDPTHAVAALLLNGLLQKGGQYAAAAAVTAPFAELPHVPAQLLTNHAAALSAVGRFSEAATVCSRALQEHPRNLEAVQLLSSALVELGRDAEAEAVLRRALSRGVDGIGLRFALGKSLWAQGRAGEAEAIYREITERVPFNAAAQRTLANLIWMRTGDAAAAEAPVNAAIAAYPGEEALHVVRAEARHWTGDVDGAFKALRPLAERGGATLRLMAARLALPIDPDFAERHALALSTASPGSPEILQALAEAQLAQGRGAAAAQTAARLLTLTPNDQHAIALQGLAWRLTGDPRERVLNDYARLVRSFTIAAPDGWPDLATFLADLAAVLDRLHTSRAHPVGQSLRGGSKTTRDLSRSSDPVIQALFRALDAPIRRYIADLGAGDDPLRDRRGAGYRFAGAWSVRLPGETGHHVSHVHSEGWISSAFYVRLPPAVEQSGQGEDSQGWLTFGESGTPTRPPLGAVHFEQPMLGKLVLFPSYLWHGTLPFSGEGDRLTVAFDVVPTDVASPVGGASAGAT